MPALPRLTRAEWLRLSAFGGAVAFLHLLGWGLFLWYAHRNPALAGLNADDIQAVASANANVRGLRAIVYPNPALQGWRVTLDFERAER